jgi:ribosome biogenesis protein BMS1
MECPSDINAMSDLSKVADLALVLIDASIGFEMETFEYLSLLNNHGFPNVMGVLTHIDYFKDNKQLRKTRKKYKKRFEYETGGNYKLFYLQALKNEYYLK